MMVLRPHKENSSVIPTNTDASWTGTPVTSVLTLTFLDRGGVPSLFFLGVDSWWMLDERGVPPFPSDVWVVDYPVA